MRILENDIYRDMTEDEIAELKKVNSFIMTKAKIIEQHLQRD